MLYWAAVSHGKKFVFGVSSTVEIVIPPGQLQALGLELSTDLNKFLLVTPMD